MNPPSSSSATVSNAEPSPQSTVTSVTSSPASDTAPLRRLDVPSFTADTADSVTAGATLLTVAVFVFATVVSSSFAVTVTVYVPSSA